MKDRVIDLLVISDRYPPRSVGGAEISLHTLLRELAVHQKVEVLSLRGGGTKVDRYVHEGVSVTEIPEQADWPQHELPMSSWRRRVMNYKKVRHFFKRRSSRLWLRRVPELAPDQRTALELAATGKLKLRGGFSIDQQAYVTGYTAKMVRRLLKGTRVRHLHADNFRAICIADAVAAEHRTYLVRDNRFDCQRFDQSRIVGNRLCGTCGLECVGTDGPDLADSLKTVLRLNSDYRLGRLSDGATVICTSHFLEQNIRALVPQAPITRVANPADDIGFVRHAIIGIPQDTGFNIVVIGMLTENKGQIDLLRKWSKILKANPDITLHYAGRGPRIEKRIGELSREYKIAGQIRVHGFLDRQGIYELLARSQIAVLPTIWAEPFGRVPLEAGMARRPVVTFGVGGLTETVVDGVTGFIVPPGNFDALAEKTLFLRDNPVVRVRMGEAAQEHIAANYAPSVILARMKQVWAEVGQESGGG